MRVSFVCLLFAIVLAAHAVNGQEKSIASEALAKIQLLGGKVTYDETAPAPPVVDIDLNGCSKFGDGFIRLLPHTNLKRLGLDDTRVTDAGLRQLGELKDLSELSLRNTDITDVGMKELSQLKGLKELDTSGTRVTVQGKAGLRVSLPQLWIIDEAESIQAFTLLKGIMERDRSLSGAPVYSLLFRERYELNEKSMRLMGTFKHLRVLHLDYRYEISPLGFEQLKRFQDLTDLVLTGTEITDASLRSISTLKQLTSLRLHGCRRITDAGLVELIKLQKLTNLDLGNCEGITDAGLVNVAKLENLTALSLGSQKVTAAGIKELIKLEKLTNLKLENCGQIDDQAAREVSQIRGLRSLDLWKTQITDAGLHDIANLSGMTHLYLGGTRITDDGLAELQKMKQLQVLSLQGAQITDAGLNHLGQLERVEYLYLRETSITDAGLNALVQLNHLKRLSVSGCKQVKGEGLKEFRNHPTLRIVQVNESGITNETLAELSMALPSLSIIR
jgi:internalin A